MLKRKILVFLTTLVLLTNTLPSAKGENQINIPYTTEENSVSTIYSDFSGNYVFVEAFATWCGSCKLEMTQLRILYQSIDGKFPMLSISIDPDSDNIEKIQEYKSENQAQWHFGLDHKLILKEAFKVSVLPTAFLFDPNGEILATWIGLTEVETFVNDINFHIPQANIVLANHDAQGKEYWQELIHNPLVLVTISFVIVNTVLLSILKFKARRDLKTNIPLNS